MPAFISHSFQDAAIYSTLCLALDAAGIDRWDPETMAGGESLAEQLRTAINSCEVCVSIATRRSIESPWCLAELGAFWGAGKRVLLFIVDPDLSDAVLPPQFKGNLRSHTAQELIASILEAQSADSAHGRTAVEFFESSAVFGADSQWRRIVEQANRSVCMMGVSLNAWVRTQDFASLIRRRAEKDGIQFRFLTLHPENPSIDDLERSAQANEAAMVVRAQIAFSSKSFSELALSSDLIEYRQLRTRTPNFALTLTDHSAVLVQYLHALNWGAGPVMRCLTSSPFFSILHREFDELWRQASPPISAGVQ
ncbi:TIR domain-containing protein [Aquincola sp. S2]|uniref:TIR domain-containing protein n=1 Tax=Pseudaquabacterium terrae TaxID=2732868 RepID=A0ABX2ERC2_9BURK|nr:toll/interleukin-1 receptor domain-containing protein [Aquabacterium terrae]NRF71224.1 TIR domain-containing protein [Aquabacterium terrae]